MVTSLMLASGCTEVVRLIPVDDGESSDDSRPALEPFTFAVIGDYGLAGEPARRVAELVHAWSPRHVFTVGDNNYPAGARETIDVNIGQYYARYIGNYAEWGAYGPGADENRFWPATGNHDWMADGIDPYLEYFTLPGAELFYTRDFGLLQIFVLDTYVPNDGGVSRSFGAQRRWLAEELERSRACFRLVTGHHPAYTTGSEHAALGQMTAMAFHDLGVDAVLTGHNHLYERIEAHGLTYFVNGAGGGTLDEPSEARVGDGGGDAGVVVAKHEGVHGAMRGSVSADELVLEFFAIDDPEVALDRWRLPRQCPSV